jgi:hypothetical protein
MAIDENKQNPLVRSEPQYYEIKDALSEVDPDLFKELFKDAYPLERDDYLILTTEITLEKFASISQNAFIIFLIINLAKLFLNGIYWYIGSDKRIDILFGNELYALIVSAIPFIIFRYVWKPNDEKSQLITFMNEFYSKIKQYKKDQITRHGKRN